MIGMLRDEGPRRPRHTRLKISVVHNGKIVDSEDLHGELSLVMTVACDKHSSAHRLKSHSGGHIAKCDLVLIFHKPPSYYSAFDIFLYATAGVQPGRNEIR